MSRSHWSGRAYISFPFACSPDPLTGLDVGQQWVSALISTTLR